MLHGVCEFMERAARNRPIVLVFEDLHWADESTLLLLRQFGSRLAQVPLLVIGTFRPDDFKGNRPFATISVSLTRDVGAEEIRLLRFTREEVAALVAARAGKTAPGELVDLIFEETQGNPFFVEELYRHLHDAGRLFDDDGGWRSSSPKKTIPEYRPRGHLVASRTSSPGPYSTDRNTSLPRRMAVVALAG